MELKTNLNPGAFNAVKLVVLYILVDNLLVWTRAKLKRAVNVADLIDGTPVPVRSITDNNGRNTLGDIYYTFKDICTSWELGSINAKNTNDSKMWTARKAICRLLSFAIIRFAPLFILMLMLILELGTDDAKKCHQKKVQFAAPTNDLGVIAESLKCTRLLKRRSRHGLAVSFRVQYLTSALYENEFYCGCESSTEVHCISRYEKASLKAPKIATWTAIVATDTVSISSGNALRSQLKMLQKVRDDFAISRAISWKRYRNIFEDAMGAFLISCFYYLDDKRSSMACVREYAMGVKLKILSRPVVYNEVLMFVKTRKTFSFIEFLVVNRNQSTVDNLVGILDGPHIRNGTLPAVFRTKSDGMLSMPARKMFYALTLLLSFYRLETLTSASQSSASRLAKMLTAYGGAKDAGKGTLRSCSGVFLSLDKIGIVAAMLLLLLPFLMCAMSLIISPESPRSLLSRSHAFESWRWTLNSLSSEEAGSWISWSVPRSDAVTILERSPSLKLKIVSMKGAENLEAPCNCTPAEIPSIA